MNGTEQMALKDVKDRLSAVVDQVERQHDRVVITKHGRPAAVVLSMDDLESLEETLEVLSRPSLVNQVHESLSELRATSPTPLTKEQALELIRRD